MVEALTVSDIVQILIPASLMLWTIRKLTSIDTSLSVLNERSKHTDEDLGNLHKAKHAHANKIQELEGRVTVLEITTTKSFKDNDA
jgi:hypothetical protein